MMLLEQIRKSLIQIIQKYDDYKETKKEQKIAKRRAREKHYEDLGFNFATKTLSENPKLSPYALENEHYSYQPSGDDFYFDRGLSLGISYMIDTGRAQEDRPEFMPRV